MTKKTIKSLEAEITRLSEVAHKNSDGKYQAQCERDAAKKEADETRSRFADLKRRLHEAEMENARLRGYMERVHEDDIVQDGFVEIEDDRGKRTVPKRRPPLVRADGSQNFIQDEFLTPFDKPSKRTHWTSY